MKQLDFTEVTSKGGPVLKGQDLREFYSFVDSDLAGADLRDCNLEGCQFMRAYLVAVDLRGANLKDARLCQANLYGADLRGANLEGSDFTGAYTWGLILDKEQIPVIEAGINRMKNSWVVNPDTEKGEK